MISALLTTFFIIGMCASWLLGTDPALAQSDTNTLARKQRCPSTCTPISKSQPTSPVILSGETVTSSLHIKFRCTGRSSWLNIAIVVDPDALTSPSEVQQAKKALVQFVRRLDLGNDPYTRIGIVVASDRGMIVGDLTNDESRVLSLISRIGNDDSQNLAEGIEAAKRMLPTTPPDCLSPTNDNVLITLSSGIPWPECSPIAKAVRGAHSNGILTMAVCLQDRCLDTRCLRQEVASSSRYFFSRLGNFSEVARVIEFRRDTAEPAPNLAQPDVINITLKEVSVVDHLAEDLEYIPNSALPQAIWSADERTLTWPMFDFIPNDGITLSYRTKPLGIGRTTLSEGAEIRWLDNQGLDGFSVLPPTSVLVLGRREPNPQ